jgi:hypothetical protein
MSENDGHNKSESQDIWYKLRAVGGIATAIVAALIGVLGSIFLHSQQESSNKIHLYTQLLSDQEKAENAVRKDMFTTILTSFLDKEEGNNDECVMDKIDRQLLELDMISRNFHETMDLRPLFIHVLLNIVQDIPRNYNFTDKEIEGLDKQETINKLSSCKQKILYRLLQEDAFKNANKIEKKKEIEKYIDQRQARKKARLTDIAKRITRKQLESLSDVERRIRFTIDLTKTCDDTPPNQPLAECDKEESKIEQKKTLNDNDEEKKRSSRIFTMSSNRSYKAWNLLRLKVTTNKLPNEIAADPDGDNPNVSEFWIGYFDFPLVDNTFLSSRERYAVVLDSINEKEAKLSLLYFPASYAGFKEKSYYQNRIMNTLLKDRFIAN